MIFAAPFTWEYYMQEINKFHIQNSVAGSVEISHFDLPAGRNDFYMRNSLLPAPLTCIPELKINGLTWMSLSPMELESHYIPIQRATGRVGVAGLGMGYYVQRILNRKEIHSIDVFEINPDITKMYLRNFGENDKVRIWQQDIREATGHKWDYFYCDIYRQLMDEQAVHDWSTISKNNAIGEYHFWTQESVIFTMIENRKEFPPHWEKVYLPFIKRIISDSEAAYEYDEAGERFYRLFKLHGIL